VRFALGKAARLHTYAGDTGSAFSLLDSRFRLNSLGGGQGASFARGLAHFVDGDHTTAAEWMEKELWECPNSVASLRYRTASLGLLGRLGDRMGAARRLLALAPGFTVSRIRWHIELDMNNAFPWRRHLALRGLRRGGIS
jgi:hypothetical protein